MKTNDIFDSSVGQFVDYTTLLGEQPAHTEIVDSIYPQNIWAKQNLADNSTCSVASSSQILIDSGIYSSSSHDSEKRLYFNDAEIFLDCVNIIKFTTPDTQNKTDTFSIGSMLQYDSVSGSFICAMIESQKLKIKTFDGTSYSSPLNTMPLDNAKLVKDTSYWLVSMIVDRKVRCELWTEDPTVAGSLRTLPVSATLPSSYSPTRGYVGVASWVPKSASANILSFESGYAFMTGSTIDTVINNRHVDIRTMIKEVRRSPRPAIGFDKYHQTANVYSQTLTLDSDPVSGFFTLLFNKSDDNYFTPVESNPLSYNATAEEIKAEIVELVRYNYLYSYFNGDAIVAVSSSASGSCFPITVEFNHFYGDLSLLRANLSPSGHDPLNNFLFEIPSSANYDSANHVATFAGNAQDSFFIENPDPVNTESTQNSLEFNSDVVTENWKLYSADGGLGLPNKFANTDLEVGKSVEYGNRRRASVQLHGALGLPWSFSLQSSTPSNVVNAIVNNNLVANYINISFLNTNPEILDLETSYIQFTSNKSGLFSNQGGSNLDDSEKVYLDGRLIGDGPNYDFRATMDLFGNPTEYARFTFGHVTGVRIVIYNGPVLPFSPHDAITVASIKSFDSFYLPSSVDINTKTQSVLVPTPLVDYELVQLPSMIRGKEFTESPEDPSPLSGEAQVLIKTQSNVEIQVMGEFNKIQTYVRYTAYGESCAEWLTTEFGYRFDMTYIKSFKTFRSRSIGGGFGDIYWEIYPGGAVTDETTSMAADLISSLSPLLSETVYLLSSKLDSNRIIHSIELMNEFNKPIRKIFESVRYTNSEWTEKNGRVGWHMSSIDDSEMRSFDIIPFSYSILRTKEIETETPIDGAQLFTVDSGYRNAFERFASKNPRDFIQLDSTKSLSGESYKLSGSGQDDYPGFISNQFSINNWSHVIIEFDIWVPKELDGESLRPRLYLQPTDFTVTDRDNAELEYVGPATFDYTSNTWSHVSVSLRQFEQYLTGDYIMLISSIVPHNANIWIDNVKINQKTVEWEIRAVRGGSWSPFRDSINKRYGAIHLPKNQRGRFIQLQAIALTEDAWISEYTLKPKYAQLGRILYHEYSMDKKFVIGKARIGAAERGASADTVNAAIESAINATLLEISGSIHGSADPADRLVEN